MKTNTNPNSLVSSAKMEIRIDRLTGKIFRWFIPSKLSKNKKVMMSDPISLNQKKADFVVGNEIKQRRPINVSWIGICLFLKN